jgi:prepilin-type N-terminal cleavage/methylation domain-containing protein
MRHAFTLIEVAIAVAIAVLIASLAAVNYRAPVTQARLTNTFGIVERLDQHLRRWTKAHNTPAMIRVNLDQGTLTAVQRDGSALPFSEVKIPAGLKLTDLRILGENRFGKDTDIPYTSEGISPCWAYRITSSSGQATFHFLIGLTGESLTFNDETELKKWERISEAD